MPDTNTKKIHLSVVSPEAEIFSGKVDSVLVKGAEGDLGISHGHLQLLTSLPPGVAHIYHNGKEELLYLSGGILEVQPESVTIMADVVKRPENVNEAAALEAKEAAEKALSGKKIDPVDFKRAQVDLEDALARLRIVELMRKKQRRGS